MIAERVVLRRIEHFEQSRRGVTTEVGTDLVDLVEQTTGFIDPASLMARTMRPGSAPT